MDFFDLCENLNDEKIAIQFVIKNDSPNSVLPYLFFSDVLNDKKNDKTPLEILIAIHGKKDYGQQFIRFLLNRFWSVIDFENANKNIINLAESLNLHSDFVNTIKNHVQNKLKKDQMENANEQKLKQKEIDDFVNILHRQNNDPYYQNFRIAENRPKILYWGQKD